jgi:hypothetical protein
MQIIHLYRIFWKQFTNNVVLGIFVESS